MALEPNHAQAMISYEELIIDILVTKSLVFSVIGLDVHGLAWAHWLAENGYATIGIRSRRAVEVPSTGSGNGILRLGEDLEEVRASDVILGVSSGGSTEARFHTLLPHLRRGQVFFSRAKGDVGPAVERRMIDDAALWGLTIGEDFFVVYLPNEPLPVGHAESSPVEIYGMTEACSRIGNAIYTRVLRRLT